MQRYFYICSEKKKHFEIHSLGLSHGLNCFDRFTFQLTQLYLLHTNVNFRLVAEVLSLKPSWSQQNVGVLVAKSARRSWVLQDAAQHQ